MRFISYYTLNTPYEMVAQKYIIPTLKKWNLKYDVQGVKNLGNWYANTGYKSKFILDMLEKHKEDVIFLDADATVEKFPSLFYKISKEYDLACHFLDWEKQWNQKDKPKELLSGTMLWRYKSKVLDLIKRWREEVKKNPHVWEQKILQITIAKEKDIKIYDLPASYTAIAMNNGHPKAYVGEPVILHHQVSRKYRQCQWEIK